MRQSGPGPPWIATPLTSSPPTSPEPHVRHRIAALSQARRRGHASSRRHVADAGLVTAADEAILEHAAANDLVIISADSDFGELLAASPGATSPSVVLLRSAEHLTLTSRQLSWPLTFQQSPMG